MRPSCWMLLSVVLLTSNAQATSDMDALAVDTIIAEAESEGLAGMTAVGEVIRNRMRKHNASVADVVLRPHQFSCWNSDERVQTVRRVAQATPEIAQRAWKAWIQSEVSNLTEGATHYHTIDVRPNWAKGHKPSAVIGNHLFYNDVQ